MFIEVEDDFGQNAKDGAKDRSGMPCGKSGTSTLADPAVAGALGVPHSLDRSNGGGIGVARWLLAH